MNPDISVIIPTYTPKEYLWECLDCLEQQTLNKDSYEVLIVLNGTKEPYFSLIKERIKNKERFTQKSLQGLFLKTKEEEKYPPKLNKSFNFKKSSAC